MSADLVVWHNSRCSKSRGACTLLAEQGVDPVIVRYLDDPPSREEIVRVMGLLGIDDPRQMMRTSEKLYRELGLATADHDGLIAAMTANPVLIERPIVIRGDRAVIARPPELLVDLLG